MDLEVIGRHALLFDDDTNASFVNSAAALVEWNSLSIDRYDVRHLLSSPPPRVKRHLSPPRHPDSPSESELDHERYLDLPSTSAECEQDLGDGAIPVNDSGYNAVPFSYGNTGESTVERNVEAESGFRPPFPVPESLLQNLIGRMIVVKGAFVILRLIMSKFQMLGAEMEVLVIQGCHSWAPCFLVMS